ncbi:phosphodiester glycosidase family protein [Paenarthrobacter aurescens]|uniref:phosphodiester glycosidase family protein n=1 Tax=Paenarthrobacter aurescens TaxID=43663 RepID=UPI0021C22E4D|nr:phosphodiester glycosidase family protein [Paenarthrobacter aurescens]MCT9871900.1 phosphodiester glycosidase family protein [Paenarthrobacter aurescens]
MTPPQTEHRKGGRTRRAVVSAVLAVTLSAGGAAAWALDRFVIPHAQITNVSEYEASKSGTAATNSTTADASSADTTASAVVTDTSYTSGDTGVTISTVTTGSGDDTVTYYVADVVLDDATTLKSAFAEDTYGENITETTSAIAEDHSAIFAVNGDYYGFRDTGIVIRNGVVYRDEGARQGLAFYKDGSVKVYDETTTTADQLIADGVWNTLSFGPSLLDNGQIASGIEDVEVDTNFGNHSIQGEQPRTAVGVIDENHLVFVVVDGRSPGYSAGVTMTGLAQIMKDLGATTAYNIDGGGSSTMYFNGSLVNNPLGGNTERGTSDILYIARS